MHFMIYALLEDSHTQFQLDYHTMSPVLTKILQLTHNYGDVNFVPVV